MSTPHNRAENGDFAKTVLMPGDPLRAKFIAETFLEDPRLVTDVRGMYGYTGTYQGRPISVMGSGMGMPSIGIYSYELYTQYGVENIIRIGSAGSYTDKAKLFDVVLATGAYSESNYAVTQSGDTDDIQTPSAALNDALRASAKAAGIPLIEGNIHSSDVFYRQPSDEKPTYWDAEECQWEGEKHKIPTTGSFIEHPLEGLVAPGWLPDPSTWCDPADAKFDAYWDEGNEKGKVTNPAGLPKKPAALNIDIDDNGNVVGLF